MKFLVRSRYAATRETGLTGAVLEGMFVQSKEERNERYGIDGETETGDCESGRWNQVSVVDIPDEGGLGVGVLDVGISSDTDRVRSE